MTYWENFLSSFKSLWANKLRSAITILGIVIGIYAVVTLLSIAQGVQKQTTDLVAGFGPRTIIILPGEQTEAGSFNIVSQFAPSTLFLDDVAALKEKATLIEPDIEYAVFVGGVLRRDEKKLAGVPVGITPGAEELFRLKPSKGRQLTQEDLDNKRRVIFLSEKTLEKLGANLGDKVFLGTNEFIVEGVFVVQQALTIGPTVEDFYAFPATVANEINQSNQINRIIVRALEAEKVNDAKVEITEILRAEHGSEDFSVLLPTDILETFNQITDILKYLVVGIASISLMVGGIGISNIMLVTVTERTREIGIRKAVGATEGTILLQFLVETVILTLVGTLIGLGLAGLTTVIIVRFSPIEPLISWQTVVLAVGMGVVAGIVFGLFPAVRAASQNPVRALKFE